MTESERPMTREEEWRYAEPALRWHGWGSPVGLGIGLVCIAFATLLFRFAWTGF